MKKLLIDGYNLLRCRSCDIGDDLPLETQRDKLIQQVEHFSARQGYHTTLVFDNRVNPANLQRPSPALRVEYGPPGKEADDVIRQKVRRARSNRQLTVVTSDRAIHATARDHGATVIDSDSFFRMMVAGTPSPDQDNAPKAQADKYHTDLDELEVDYWKRLFEQGGDDD